MNESHKYTECTPFLFRGRVGDGVYFKYFYNSTGEKMLRSVMTSGGTPTLTYYMGPFVHEGLLGGTISLKYIMTPEGRIVNNGTDTSPSWSWEYDLKDHLGNVRVVLGDSTVAGYARVLQQNHYYPFGMRMSQISTALTSTGNDYLYNGKQYQDDLNLNWYDYGARFYDPALGRWHTVDPMAEKYYSTSPYAYCANNPILLIDPDGMDWFYYSKDGKSDPTWNWRDEHEYHTGVKDSNGKEVVLQGTEAAVVFNGSRQEKLGTKDGREGYIDGEGAATASVTVYGPDGANDVHTYTGYTMTSDATRYGAVDEGIYDANYDAVGKSGTLKSHWTLNNRGEVRMMDGEINPNAPSQIDENGEGYKNQIFIHSSNTTGFAGRTLKGAISTGCLLIAPNDWSKFNNVMSGVQHFKVQIIRTQIERVSLQGVTGPVPNMFILQKIKRY